MEARYIEGELLRRVALRVDANEDRRDLFGFRTELLECCGHHLQARRADVWTVREAEEDQQMLAAEILVRHAAAGMVSQREWPTDGGLADGQHLCWCLQLVEGARHYGKGEKRASCKPSSNEAKRTQSHDRLTP